MNYLEHRAALDRVITIRNYEYIYRYVKVAIERGKGHMIVFPPLTHCGLVTYVYVGALDRITMTS